MGSLNGYSPFCNSPPFALKFDIVQVFTELKFLYEVPDVIYLKYIFTSLCDTLK
jgi:hypothetical protein